MAYPRILDRGASRFHYCTKAFIFFRAAPYRNQSVLYFICIVVSRTIDPSPRMLP